jgi:hypothetical protein
MAGHSAIPKADGVPAYDAHAGIRTSRPDQVAARVIASPLHPAATTSSTFLTGARR